MGRWSPGQLLCCSGALLGPTADADDAFQATSCVRAAGLSFDRLPFLWRKGCAPSPTARPDMHSGSDNAQRPVGESDGSLAGAGG